MNRILILLALAAAAVAGWYFFWRPAKPQGAPSNWNQLSAAEQRSYVKQLAAAAATPHPSYE